MSNDYPKKSGLRYSFTKFLRQIQLQFMVLPAIIWLIIFCYIPMIGIIIAFKDYNFKDGIFGSSWVGLTNIKEFFNDSEFFVIIRNTFAINILKAIFMFPLPIIFTILLYEMRVVWLKKLTQTVSYLPHFISWVIVAGMFSGYFSLEGTVNQIIQSIGVTKEPIMWLAKDWFFWPLMVLTGVWKEVGWNAIIYVAALSNINPELFEAASVDGASRFKKIMHITLPSLKPAITITFLFLLAGMFTAGFDQIFLFQNSINLPVSEVIDTYIYKSGIADGLFSFSAAGGLFQSLINLTIIVVANYFAKKINGIGLW